MCGAIPTLPHTSSRRATYRTSYRVCFISEWSRDSSVGIVTRLRTARSGSGSLKGRDSSLRHSFQTCPGAHPVSYPRLLGALSSGLKRLWHDADHIPLSDAKINIAWSCTSSPSYIFMLCCLIKHRDNASFYKYLYSVKPITGNTA